MTRNKTSRKKSCEDKSLFQKIFGKVDELLHTGIDVFTLFPYEADFGIKSRFDRYSSHMFKLGHHAREEETAAAVLFKKTQCRVNLAAVHMVEMRDGKKVLVTPVSAEDIADIKIGDIVYLDGDLMTCRDVAHRRLVEHGRALPYDIKDKAIFHAGPIVRPIEGEEDAYEMVSVGPTTSMRMEKFEYEFTKQTGVRVIVGKGGMGLNTERACKEFGAIHCVFPAGCAVVATEVQRIAEHHWDELGMPETLWCCKVKEFGPLIVSIDSQGRNMFEENKVTFNEKKDAAIEEISKHVGYIK